MEVFVFVTRCRLPAVAFPRTFSVWNFLKQCIGKVISDWIFVNSAKKLSRAPMKRKVFGQICLETVLFYMIMMMVIVCSCMQMNEFILRE